jgi:predicted adenine nucleotide alpha hydrolase (AANH) superfamily ATPase
MNILLHICCAPCAIAPVERLREKGHAVTGFFYNPNIHPYSEYLRRKSEVEKYAKETGLNVVHSDYDIEKYFQHIVYNEALRNRCPVCWWLRLENTAKTARDEGFDMFTTTLLVSPYQNQDIIRDIGQDISKRTKVGFYHEDFRPFFKEAHAAAKSRGIYCQNYCGCVFSEKESIDRRNA